MRTALKWIGIGVGGLVGIAAIAAVVLAAIGSSKLNRSYQIASEALALSTPEDALERGRHLEVAVLGCTDCHGEDLAGDLLLKEPGLFEVHAPNLTSGAGGAAARYGDADWVRAIRHGVAPDGRGLLFMPAEVFSELSSEDLASIIAYVRGFPPVDNAVPSPTFSLLGRIVIGLGQLPETLLLPASGIDHDAPLTASVAPAASAEYGSYLASIAYCTLCHGQNLSGGAFPYPDPDAPPVPSLAAAGGWTAEQFMATMRTGITPSGKTLDEEYMPWGDFDMTDEELTAVWLHVRALMGGAR